MLYADMNASNMQTLLQLIHPEGGELFTVFLAGGLSGDERPGLHPRRDEEWEGKQLVVPALHLFEAQS